MCYNNPLLCYNNIIYNVNKLCIFRFMLLTFCVLFSCLACVLHMCMCAWDYIHVDVYMNVLLCNLMF